MNNLDRALIAITVHDPITLEEIGGTEGIGIKTAKLNLTRLIHSLEEKINEEKKYE